MGDPKHLRQVSPRAQAARARAPILLLHGTDDSVVPVEQSRRMHAALRKENKDVTFIELKGDDHWLSTASMRTQMLSEVEKFLARQLAIAPPVAAEARSQWGLGRDQPVQLWAIPELFFTWKLRTLLTARVSDPSVALMLCTQSTS